MKRLLAAILATIAIIAAARAADNDYGLKAVQVADGVYVFTGKIENFSRENGGNIVNTGFIIGTDGVIVIDTGPSRLYGEQQRAAIAKVTPLPVTQVYITHAHPDHFLGDQAYPPGTLAALPATAAAIRKNGESLSDNLYRLVGGWMIGNAGRRPDARSVCGAGHGRRAQVAPDRCCRAYRQRPAHLRRKNQDAVLR